ncbi:M23 family metallopeptidase [Algivirga pacifica]|uniref:M23 family metallopeptidase n=1 Tax=Algivirga pacifica TaxID=1162670 RepID=A0ABP9DAE9_9BACT
MAKIKYYYDTETCRYERVKTSNFDIFLNAVGILFLCSIFGFGFSLIYDRYFPSAEEQRLANQVKVYQEALDKLEGEMSSIDEMMTVLQERDNDIYRVVLGAEPIAMEVRRAGTGGSKNLFEMLENGAVQEESIVTVEQKLKNLKRQMFIQTQSYDEVAKRALEKEDMLASMPAIQPVENKKMKRLASGYGMRIHPIYKVKKMHRGIDFSAKKGTPIYATGNGKVVKARKSNRGYGWHITIDHKYGYQTLYAHMSKFDVKVGEVVKRGQKIGEIGNTGSSTAPHLHYEVRYKKRAVNPIKYFTKDISPEQYAILLERASRETQSLGYSE